jgi:uncharacterized membrane protein
VAGTALGVYGWLTIGNAVAFFAWVFFRRPTVFLDIAIRGKRLFLTGGGCSFTAYALAMWAFTQAPIALVTAVRETSIVFALLIGVLFLKEKLDIAKVFATFLTVTGAPLPAVRPSCSACWEVMSGRQRSGHVAKGRIMQPSTALCNDRPSRWDGHASTRKTQLR